MQKGTTKPKSIARRKPSYDPSPAQEINTDGFSCLLSHCTITRSTRIDMEQSNGQHPDTLGILMIYDTLFSFLQQHFLIAQKVRLGGTLSCK